MKKYLTLGIFLLFFALLHSCVKPPVACFTFSRDIVKVGDTVTLLNCSSNFTDVLWHLPFGATTSAVNPRVKLQNAGIFEATLEVGKNGFENANSITATLKVNP